MKTAAEILEEEIEGVIEAVKIAIEQRDVSISLCQYNDAATWNIRLRALKILRTRLEREQPYYAGF